MGLLPRLAKLSLAVAALVVLTSLPVPPAANRNPGSALTPRISWAGGSPDETLKPTTTPDPKKSASIRTATGSIGGSTRFEAPRSTAIRRLTLRERFDLAYRILRIYAVR